MEKNFRTIPRPFIKMKTPNDKVHKKNLCDGINPYTFHEVKHFFALFNILSKNMLFLQNFV